MRYVGWSKYGLYNCYNCLCEVCTRRHCQLIQSSTKPVFCDRMRDCEFCPVRKCDFFEHKEIHMVWRVKRIGKNKRSQQILDKLNEILAKMDRM